jgi:choline kinase
MDLPLRLTLLINPQYDEGSIVSLWTARHQILGGQDLLLMDADVLYNRNMIVRLLQSPFANCFLLDRNFIPGEEPVKLCVAGGNLIEFRKFIPQDLRFDFCGESVGFFRFSKVIARQLIQICERYVNAGRAREPHEEAIRDLLLNSKSGTFGFEDITGLPWTEIDFPEDLKRAREVIFPQL